MFTFLYFIEIMITIIYVLSIVFGMVSGKLTCIDEEGDPVDM